MNKRGQIYILAAIILATILYSLATTVNYIKQESLDDDFEKISKNYELESSKLINNLLLQETEDINESFNIFTVLFTSYSKAQNPSYGIVYTLSFKDDEGDNKIQIGNYLDKGIYMDANDDRVADDLDGDGTPGELIEDSLNGCFEKVPATLTFDGLNLGGSVNQGDIELCILIIDYVNSIKIGIPEDGGEIIWYNMDIIQDKPQIVIISHLEEKKQRKVFIGGEGFVMP